MSDDPTGSDKTKVFFQQVAPQHFLSRGAGWLTRARFPKAVVRGAVNFFSRRFEVDLSEADMPTGGFANFDDFFTRPLKVGARQIDADPQSLVSPVDGRVSAAGPIASGNILQAKGQGYTVAELLGSEEDAAVFEGGTFATLYLSPRDYHRMHAPCDLQASKMVYLPGSLFSVNPATVRARERLFSRNERVALFFEAPTGPLAMIFVGALIVGSIEVAWEGIVAPPGGRRKGQRVKEYGPEGRIALAKGAEVGRFHMGSTVILLVPPGTGKLDDLPVERPVRLGEPIGRLS